MTNPFAQSPYGQPPYGQPPYGQTYEFGGTSPGAPVYNPQDTSSTPPDALDTEQQIQEASAIITSALDAIERAVNSSQDVDVHVVAAKALNESAKRSKSIKDIPRTFLWNNFGAGTHATSGGLKFSLSKPHDSRRVNYKLLEAHPDVYAEVVKEIKARPDTIGTLTIK